MGICVYELEYFVARGMLGQRVLDLGAQLLHHTDDMAAIRRVAGGKPLDPVKLRAFSAIKLPFVAALYDMLGIEYVNYDVCPGPNTVPLDLNRDNIPVGHRNRFDLVTNCGTTEHLINQLNCFRIMHDAVKTGGILYHQVPASGYFNHGYLCYHEQFFRDLAEINDYEIVDLWYVYRGDMQLEPSTLDMRHYNQPMVPHSHVTPATPEAPSYNLAVVLRKRIDAPLRLPLELRTSGTSLLDNFPDIHVDAVGTASGVSGARGKELAAELMSRIKRRAKALVAY